MSSQNNSKDGSSFAADGHATLIGSIPLTSHDEALELVFQHTPHIPLWPQLPGNRLEGMLQQFNEGLPGIASEGERLFFNTRSDHFEAEQLAFFEQYLEVAENFEKLADSRFKVSPSHAEGLYKLLEKVKNRHGILALKGQITGPFTLLTGIADQDNRAGYYDPMIREMITKGLAMKAAWQVTFLKNAGKPVIVFIDEPALAGLGSSSFISISKEDISTDQNEMIGAIHQAGGLAGIHVCANTDWALLLSLDFDILNFDAYGFFDRLVSFKNEVYAFLGRGGIIAWGLIPTSEKEYILAESTESLVARWEEQASQLVNNDWNMSALLRRSLITPSCGTGALTVDLAARVLELTGEVSQRLREKYLRIAP
jgi:methionine synthase II (cobalamin-independent)